MKHEYSDEFSYPPALIMPAKVIVPHDARLVRSYRAKLDTAADLSVVPRSFIEEFRPASFYKRTVRQTGRVEYTFILSIELDGRVYSVEVVPHNAPYLLIGRDILNQLVLIANGPNEVFELIHSSP